MHTTINALLSITQQHHLFQINSNICHINLSAPVRLVHILYDVDVAVYVHSSWAGWLVRRASESMVVVVNSIYLKF